MPTTFGFDSVGGGSGSSGITDLNGLTVATQTFAVGSAGVDFGIVSVSPTHTFNLPDASAVSRGALTSTDWSTFNGKLSTAILSINGMTGTAQTINSGTTGTDFNIASVGDITTLNLPTASAVNRGALSSADWSTFNGKLSTAILSINGMTGTAQTINSGSSGSDLNIASVGNVVTVNIPSASTTARGLVTTGTQTFGGNKTFIGESAVSGTALTVQNSTPTTVFSVANQGRITVKSDASVTTQSVAVIINSTTNSGIVLGVNGTGVITTVPPDGTATGGNARGTSAVDLQMSRSGATAVASGNYSFMAGGINGTCSGLYATKLGGFGGSSTGYASVSFGGGSATNTGAFASGDQNTASGVKATVLGGGNSQATADNSVVLGGDYGLANLLAQRVTASGRFASVGDAQTSALTWRRSITGTAITELFLDGTSVRAILNLPTGSTNARAWRVQIDLVAIVSTAGGTAVLNDCFMGSYVVGIKRAGTSTSLVGTVSTQNEVSNTSMSTAVVTIDADDTNEALRLQFTPPTTADVTTVIRVVASGYITEVGR